MTKIQITPKWKDVKPSGSYVYVHKRMTDGTIFYVGKGIGRRGWHKGKSSGRSQWWVRTASKNGINIEIVQDGLSDYDSSTLEMWLISKFRHEGVKLCNISDGGEGARGVISKSAIPIRCSNGMRFSNAYDAAEWLSHNGIGSASHSYVSSAVRGEINSAYGLSWWQEGRDPVDYKCKRHLSKIAKHKPVVCSNGMEFESLKSASQWVSSWRGNSNYGTISDCCNKRTLSAYGFSWWFKGQKEIPYAPRYERMSVTRGKPLVRCDGKVFHSAGEAARHMTRERGVKSSSQYISKAANSGSLAYGYRWSR